MELGAGDAISDEGTKPGAEDVIGDAGSKLVMGDMICYVGTKSGTGDWIGDAGSEPVMGDVISDAGKPDTGDVTIDSSQSEREFRNLAAPQFPENRGATIIIEI